ncbi:MAG: HAMP domain-containing sensor histidine kinase [Cyclobacteriaceae bacterium]
MKLLNQSIRYLSVSILGIVTLWAVVFYVNMLAEIKGSIDEGLENYKRIIIHNAQNDSTILTKQTFDESFFTIQPIGKQSALSQKDQYLDTILYMQDADDEALEPEPVRMLISAFEIEGRYYQLKVANSMVEEDDLIEALLWDVVWLYIILIGGIIFINNVALKRLWKPFYDFLYQLKSFRLGHTHKLPATATPIREFTDLQDAVNMVLQENIHVYDQQKQFIGNASHELQTPLAIATNKLELLLENKEFKAADAEKVAEVYHIIQRLVRLNKSLLLLTKIENRQFPNDQMISFNEHVRRCVDDLEDMSAYKGIAITVTESSELQASMDASLADVLLSNLIRNAVFHNVENGTVHINLSDEGLKIVNTGTSQALDERQVFTRFYKSDTEKNNTGLGLAIAKAIADLYGFTIRYRFESDLHCFELHISSPQ